MTAASKFKCCILFVIVLALLLSSLSFAHAQQQPSAGEKFRFVVLPDMHFHPEDDDETKYRQAAVKKVVDEIKPAFVIQTGDIIDLEGPTESNRDFVLRSFEAVERDLLSKLGQSNIDLLYSPGNHDGSEDADFHSQVSIPIYNDFWSRHRPKFQVSQLNGEFGRYYSFNYKNSHFVALYAPGAGLKDAAEQNAWLKNDLEQAKAAGAVNIFTFAHPPLYSPKLTRWEDRSDKKFLQNDLTLMNTLLTYQVKVHFGGHIHVYVSQKTGGVNEIIGGMLGGGRRALASAGRTQPFTFTVVDVEGDKVQAYPIEFKSELNDFDTSVLPPAPAVDNPLSAPVPIEQLAAASVCPAGTRPALPGEGDVAGMTSPPGIALGTPPAVIDSSAILAKAREKENVPYGTGTGQYTETHFIVYVLNALGLSLSSEAQATTLCLDVTNEIVENDDPKIHCIELALTSAGMGDSVDAASAKAGDFVMYWWKEGETWKRGAGIVESVKGGGKFDVFGAHSSLGKVTSLKDADLNPPRKAFFVRLKPSAAPVSPPTAPSTAPAITGCGSRIAAVGDSITVAASYVKYLRNMCGDISIQNDDGDPATPSTLKAQWPAGTVQGDRFAYSGKGTGQMLSDFDAVLATRPETVIILGGTNDVTGSWEGIKHNLERMYNAAKEKGIRVVALTIPPYDTAAGRAAEERRYRKSPGTILNNVKQLNDWILTQSPADVKVNIYDVLVDPTEPDAMSSTLYAGERRIHPNEEGKRKMAQKVFEALSGAAVPSVPGAAPAVAPSPIPTPTSPVTCVPESALPTTLYDFIINSTFGSTTIVGIARQSIAIGIRKESQLLQPGAVCLPIVSNMDYNLDFFKSTYGRSQMDVEQQLVDAAFMGKPVKVHRLVQPVFGCVEQAIQGCEEGKNYDFASISSYEWVGVDNDDDLLATSSFGISLNINLDRNPNSQDGELRTDIPQCVIDTFRRFGFRWGGDFGSVKMPSYFVFMASPSEITVQGAFACPAGMEQVTGPTGMRSCQPVPIGVGENAEAKIRFAEAIEALGKGAPYNTQTGHPTCCGDWVAMVYKWSGYAYMYEGSGSYDGLDDVARKHGYPIGYNDNRGAAGHALILLGFGPEANWWLERFPDIPIRSHTRSVSENEALVISYLDAESKNVEFWTYPRAKYPERIKNTKPGEEGPAKITFVHTFVPLCQGQYLQEKADNKYGGQYAGLMYWSNDQAGGGGPWSRYWEPDSRYYPKGGQCSAASGVA